MRKPTNTAVVEKPQENKFKLISIVGKERCDFPYFLLKTLEERGKKYLIFDNSLTNDLFNSLQRADEDENFVEYSSMVFMKNRTILPEILGPINKFDVVIFYHGLNPDYGVIDISDLLVITTDYIPVTHKRMLEFVDFEELAKFDKERTFMIFLDKCSSKVHEKIVYDALGLPVMDNQYEIFVNEEDQGAYLNFVYNGISQKATGLSSEYKSALNAIKKALSKPIQTVSEED